MCVLAESDNESAPSSTPTKISSPDDAQKIARSKSQELALLEKIQAEAAAYYRYDALPQPPRARVRLAAAFDEPPPSALDFKVLSLEEIRARKSNDAIVQNKPITINLSRKRKLSTQETITTSGNKIIKIVRNNSIVYKKLNTDAPAVSAPSKADQKQCETDDRKHLLSDRREVHEDELVDNCFEFKRIKITQVENTSKPKLIRNGISNNKSGDKQTLAETVSNRDTDSDSEVQIVELTDNIDLCDSEVIDLETIKPGQPIDVVDLSEDQEESNVTLSDLDLELGKNIPDVVASCHKQTNKVDSSESKILIDVDSLLDDNVLWLVYNISRCGMHLIYVHCYRWNDNTGDDLPLAM